MSSNESTENIDTNIGNSSSLPSSSSSPSPSATASDTTDTLRIVIRTIDNQEYPISTTLTTSIPSLRAQIAEASGLAAELQRLIYKGKVLKDDKLLSDYGVQQGHVIHMVERTPEGAPLPASTSSNSNGQPPQAQRPAGNNHQPQAFHFQAANLQDAQGNPAFGLLLNMLPQVTQAFTQAFTNANGQNGTAAMNFHINLGPMGHPRPQQAQPQQAQPQQAQPQQAQPRQPQQPQQPQQAQQPQQPQQPQPSYQQQVFQHTLQLTHAQMVINNRMRQLADRPTADGQPGGAYQAVNVPQTAYNGQLTEESRRQSIMSVATTLEMVSNMYRETARRISILSQSLRNEAEVTNQADRTLIQNEITRMVQILAQISQINSMILGPLSTVQVGSVSPGEARMGESRNTANSNSNGDVVVIQVDTHNHPAPATPPAQGVQAADVNIGPAANMNANANVNGIPIPLPAVNVPINFPGIGNIINQFLPLLQNIVQPSQEAQEGNGGARGPVGEGLFIQIIMASARGERSLLEVLDCFESMIAFNESGEEELSLLSDFLCAIMRDLTLRDFMQMRSVSFAQRLRESICRFFRGNSRLLNEQTATPEALNLAVETLLQGSAEEVIRLLGNNVRADVDVRATLRRLFNDQMSSFIQYCFSNVSHEEFSSQLDSRILDAFMRVTTVFRACLAQGSDFWTLVVQNLCQRYPALATFTNLISNSINSIYQNNLAHFMGNGFDAQQHLIMVTDANDSQRNNVQTQQRHLEQPVSTQHQQPRLQDVTRSSSASTSPAIQSEPWHAHIPESERMFWAATIANDVQKQKNNNYRRSFSPSYASGMPKDSLIQYFKENPTKYSDSQVLFKSTLESSLEATRIPQDTKNEVLSSVDQSQLANLFRQQLRQDLSKQATESADYDAAKHENLTSLISKK